MAPVDCSPITYRKDDLILKFELKWPPSMILYPKIMNYAKIFKSFIPIVDQ